jgi:hypothetical protein
MVIVNKSPLLLQMPVPSSTLPELDSEPIRLSSVTVLFGVSPVKEMALPPIVLPFSTIHKAPEAASSGLNVLIV